MESIELDLVSKERTKCKCCGNDIIYDNTKVYRKRNGSFVINGTSYLTTKKVNGKIYHLKVCQKCLFKKFQIDKPHFNIMWEPSKFAFEISDEDYKKSKNEYALTEEKMIKKYGKKEGVKKWENYCKRQAETNTFEYKQKNYGWSKEEFDAYNKSRAVTKNNMIQKYGEEGIEKYNNYIEKQRITKSWDYMVKVYGVKKAREINKSKALTKDNFIKKYGEIDGEEKWKKYIDNRETPFSKISQECFDRLDAILSKDHDTYYYSKNKEYPIECGNIVYHLDYYIKDLNICIEFNGSIFHGDPRIYEDNEHCNPFNPKITAKELQEKDIKRYKDLYIFHKIKTFVIWELDYINDWNEKEFIIKELGIKL